MKITRQFGRYNPWPIVSHNASASEGSDGSRPWLIVVLPVVAAGSSALFQFRFGDLTALLSAVTLLVGAMISSFSFSQTSE